MPPKPWKTLSTRLVYQNPWTKVREDIAEMPNGKTTIYGVIMCSDAVGVLPFVDDDHIALVRQYRYVFEENQRWEMPTGGWRGCRRSWATWLVRWRATERASRS